MTIDRVVVSCEEAVADIPDGATILFGGVAARGTPDHLIVALARKGTRDITAITIECTGGWGSSDDISLLIETGQVKKVITSYAVSIVLSKINAFERRYREGDIELEMVPFGTMAERIRCAGAGLGGVYVPTGVGTLMEEGKEKRVINGKEYLLELPLHADFTLIKAYKADRMGNLTYRVSARNMNPVMATAARVTIAEVEEIIETGKLDPETIVTPAIYVHRVVEIR